MSTLNQQTLQALQRIARGEKHHLASGERKLFVASGWVQYRVPGSADAEFELTRAGSQELKRHTGFA